MASTSIFTLSPLSTFPPKSKPSSSLSLSSSNSLFFNAKTTKSLILTARFHKNRKRNGLSCTCLFGLGVPELVVIAGVAALVFGPKKLPEIGQSIGKTVKSFQQAAKEFETELKKEPDSLTESTENPTPVSQEEKQDVTVPSSKET
ncbi:Sec-independent protein translocase protein TatA/B/E [Dillenia turbinata]|uniref:Sec-independent protein translocase protein TatA/B/E n=1 Tax=Dillenia turbinata TaxID=194707 RepID=A0AAN8U730_9MAGN